MSTSFETQVRAVFAQMRQGLAPAKASEALELICEVMECRAAA